MHLAFGPIYGPEGSLLERVQRFRTTEGSRITTHEVPSLVREVSPLQDAQCLTQLRELILRLRPDIVHTHSSKAGIIGRVAAWQVQDAFTPACGAMGVVHTIHGPPFMPVEGGMTQRAKVMLNNAIYTLAEYVAAHHCHSIVSVADAMTEQYLARSIGDASLYTTVRSGMETEQFVHAKPGEDRASMRALLGLRDDDFAIVTVARLAEHKGHDDLLDAFATLREQGRAMGKRPVLVWVGDGWWKQRLVQRAESMGISVRERAAEQVAAAHNSMRDAHADIVLTGLVPPTRVPSLIRACDVLAHPSSREGLPRTVPQALLAGVCPVAYDVDGTREACIEMKTGRLVTHRDVVGLAAAIVWCMREPEKAQQLARTGQAWARTAFATSTMVDQLEKVYERAIDAAKSRAERLANHRAN